MRILLLSAYDSASHRYWREGLLHHLPRYEWQVLTLPGRYFSWRIRGNPLSWYASEGKRLSQAYDLILATSMVDLATLRGLFPSLARVPAICYFHENQFAYPLSERQTSALEAQMVNLYSALAADQLLFNSEYNRLTFCQGVDALLQRLPDHKPEPLTASLLNRSQVLPVPLAEPPRFSAVELNNWATGAWQDSGSVLRLIWNARWEYDKGPDRLLALLRVLLHSGIDFRLAVLGQHFRQIPESMHQIKALFQRQEPSQLVHWGYVEQRQDYQRWLASADVVLSTAIHEFQGLSVLEAIAAGCTPLLPARLAYPEYAAETFLYGDAPLLNEEAASAVVKLKTWAASKTAGEALPKTDVSGYLWPQVQADYTEVLERVATGGHL